MNFLVNFRNIATFLCLSCNYKWTAPDIKKRVNCPKCHKDKVTITDARIEKAPLQ